MMMRNSAGFWTGYVKCDHPECEAYLSQDEIKRQSLLERRWQCVIGLHYCDKHHKTAEDLPEGSEKYVEYWSQRLAATSPSPSQSTTDTSGTSTMPQGT